MICALCKQEAELMDSHIIPKLVYRRIKSHPNSRFRSLDNISKIWQDGEKRKMLCHDCEEKFSALETFFANHLLDPYLKNETIPSKYDSEIIFKYILSVAWRILWDDLYRGNSHNDSDYIREEFVEFEKYLRDYLLSGNNNLKQYFNNNVYLLKDLVSCSDKIAEGTLFGYSYYPNVAVGCLVLVYYAGLVFVTHYTPPRRIVVQSGEYPKVNLRDIISEELVYEFTNLISLEKENMTEDLENKIKNRYNIK